MEPSSELKPRVLPHAPEELTRTRLRRLGEGIGKVVYTSEHWVVKRERTASEILALILAWKLLRTLEHVLPGKLGQWLLPRPSKRMRYLRVLLQAIVLLVPRSIWFTSHIGDVWRTYKWRDKRGERLAEAYLAGTSIVPQRVTFPPAKVQVGGWPGWLTVCEATERMEGTLRQRLAHLAEEERFDELEQWLNRFLDLRQAGWQRGLFSVDAHLNNYGVTGERIVLLDPGGLTDRWSEIEDRLRADENVEHPHKELGLEAMLESRPDIARRFDARWKATVNREQVRRHWPASADKLNER